MKKSGQLKPFKNNQKNKKKFSNNDAQAITGTYVWNNLLKKVIKISSDIPKLSARTEKTDSALTSDFGSCGREACAGGTCATTSENLDA